MPFSEVNRRSRALARAVTDEIGTRLAAEGERVPLWAPVAFGLGIGLYFALAAEPPAVLVVLAVCLAAAALWRARRHPAAAAVMLGALLVALGFAVAQLRAWEASAPRLERVLSYAEIEGRVASIDRQDGRQRVVLDEVAVGRPMVADPPARVRLRLLPGEDTAIGDRVRVRARLSPPPGPALPGAFDFQRMAYFQGIGAVGFAMGRVTVVEHGRPGGFSARIERMRHAIRDHLDTRFGDAPDGRRGLAIALLTGLRGDLPAEDHQAMRVAGLAHLLAISGLHVGLVAGFVFFIVRAGLALAPPIALRFPIKKWAAIAALGAATFYLLLSGATVPTQRAYLMLLIALVALLIDRLQVTMRPVAWAALVILALFPESLATASFQLSFAAVVALIAAWEAWRTHVRRTAAGADGAMRLVLRGRDYLAGVAGTTVIATVATLPFAVYHFNLVPTYGLAANLVAVPLMAFVVMPFGFLALLLQPLGLDGGPLWVMGTGLDAVLATAHAVTAWPGSSLRPPAMPLWGLLVIVAGGLWLTLWTRAWRLAGLPLVVAGFVSIMLVEKPDLIVADDARRIAVYDGNGGYWLRGQPTAYAAEVWLRRAGGAEALPWPDGSVEANGRRLSCDAIGCVLAVGGRLIAMPQDARALDDDCATADAVVALVAVRGWRRSRTCGDVEPIIDLVDLRREGTHAIRVSREAISVRSSRAVQGDRPWSTGRPPRWWWRDAQ